MQTYDYRIPNEAVDQAGAKIDKLSGKDRLKLAETAKDMQQAQEAEQFVKAKEYFTNAVLPGLKDFAEMSGSILTVEEHDERMSMQVCFRCDTGFDITESCRLMRSLLLMAGCIGIASEDGESILSLTYDYGDLLDS